MAADEGPRYAGLTRSLGDGTDAEELAGEVNTSHLTAVTVHGHDADEAFDPSEVIHADGRAVVAHAAARLAREPAFDRWLARPRSLATRVVAFVSGYSLVIGLYLCLGMYGVFIAGYLLFPLTSPGASRVLARSLVVLVQRSPLPVVEADGLTVLASFGTGTVATFVMLVSVTASWLKFTWMLLVPPILFVIFVLVLTPLYYWSIRETPHS